MLKKIISMFSGDDDASREPASGSTAVASKPAPGEPDLDGFVHFVVTSLVDEPDQVKISREDQDKEVHITIDCAKSDIGRIIGRKGRNIDSIRSLVRGAARRANQKVSVEITDK